MPDDDEQKSPPDNPEPLILPRRRAAPSRETVEEADRASELADLADSVKALSQRLNSPALPVEAPAESNARGSRRWRKLAKPEPLPDPPPGVQRTAAGAPARSRLARPGARRPPRRRQPLGVWLAAQAFGFGLIGLGYFVGQFGSSPGKPAAGRPMEQPGGNTRVESPAVERGPRGVSERAFQMVNLAMAAAREGNAAGARDALETAQREEIFVPGSDYRLALLAIQRGDLQEAKLRLDCAMAAHQEIAGCCYVRAMLAGAIGDYGRAAEECAKAAYAEPFSARCLFFWAECLRRNGRTQESIDRFGEALTRPASPADLEYIAFKLRLVKIEAGRSGDFSADLAKQLSMDPVAPAWLLTAAALALEAGDPAGAAGHLERARRQMAPADFDLQTRDYLFVSHSAAKEIAPFFTRASGPASPSPNVAAITVDLLSWTLQSADPGAWPSAAHR